MALRQGLSWWNGAIMAGMRLFGLTGRLTDLARASPDPRLPRIAQHIRFPVSCRSERRPWRACHPRRPRGGWCAARPPWSQRCLAARLLSRKRVVATSCPWKSSDPGNAHLKRMALRVCAQRALSSIALVVLHDPVPRRSNRFSRVFYAKLSPQQFSVVILRWGGARDGSRHLGGFTHERTTRQRLAY
jgi:hypothetical protein